MVDVPVVQITPGRLLDTRIITVIRPRIDESVSKRIDTRHELCIALNLPDPTNRAMRLSFSLRVCAYMRARVCVARIKIHLIGPELVCYSHWGEKVTRGRLVARSANKRIGSAATSCFIIHRCKDWEWKTNREFLLIVARSSVKRIDTRRVKRLSSFPRFQFPRGTRPLPYPIIWRFRTILWWKSVGSKIYLSGNGYRFHGCYSSYS